MQNYIVEYKSIKNGYARINKDGILELSVPKNWQKRPELIDNLVQKAAGLQKRYSERRQIEKFNDDGVAIFGEWVNRDELESTPKTSISLLKTLLYDYAKPILDDYSVRLGKKYNGLTIKKSKTKRGTCSHDQKIMLNSELVHLPTRLIMYVIIHEACHLRVKNHSNRFRELVAIYCPNYKILRKELRGYILK